MDLLYLRSNLNNIETIEALQLNNEEFKILDYQKMETYLKLFGNTALNKRFQIFKEVTNVGAIWNIKKIPLEYQRISRLYH